MPALVYLDASGAERRKALRTRITVGRLPDNDLVLADTLVSRRHCVIERRGEIWLVHDEGSRFGTFVNEVRAEPDREIRAGDVLRVGNTNLRFVDAADEPLSDASTEESTGNVLVHPPGQIGPRDSIEHLLAEARAAGEDLVRWVRDPSTVNLQATPLSTAIGVVDRIRRAEAMFAEVKLDQVLLSTLNEVGKLISLVTDLDTVLRLTMDMALRALKADRGFILLRNRERPSGWGKGAAEGGPDALVPRLAHNMGEIKNFSESIARTVVGEGRPVLTMDAQVDPRFRLAHSIQSQAVHAVMCVPLRNKNLDAIGAIYVEGVPGNPSFSERGVEFLAGFASQAAISIENAQLTARHAADEERRRILSRYFSEPVIGEIVAGGDASMGGAVREITVLFTDIRGFTSLLERLEPSDAVEMLNDYFTELVEEILVEKGTLDKYTGDGVMAFWGAPIGQEDHALRAVRAALRMQVRLKPLLERWRKEGRSFASEVGDLATGIGVHTGMAVVGSIGSPRRLEYTAIGDAVNVASRVQALSGGGDVLVTLATLERISGKVTAQPLPPAEIRGRRSLVPLFRVTNLVGGP